MAARRGTIIKRKEFPTARSGGADLEDGMDTETIIKVVLALLPFVSLFG